MISSDLHGAEELIRWLLGWKRQDEVVTGPCTNKKKDAPFRTFGRYLTHGDQPLADGTMVLVIRMPPRTGWTMSGACGSVLGLFGTCDRLQEPQRGQRLVYWMLIMP
jgi:hypothetical protein